MRPVLIVTIALAAAVFVYTFLGQSAAFYRWHNGSMEVRKFLPSDPTAAKDFESRIWHSSPRWHEWVVIRLLSGALLVTASVGICIERRGRHARIT